MALDPVEKRWRVWKLNTWNHMNLRTVNGKYAHLSIAANKNRTYFRKGIRLMVERPDFYEWCEKNKEKVLAIWLTGELASIDRIDSDGPYALENMRILTAKENGALSPKNVLEIFNVPVVALNIETGEKSYFKSMASAAASLGVGEQELGDACRGFLHIVGGHFVSYANKSRIGFGTSSPELYRDGRKVS